MCSEGYFGLEKKEENLINPFFGLLADPYFCRDILPAKKDFLPASTAFFIDSAIKIGFLAFAIAVLISTPSQPNSIAIEASDAIPIPASTITGTLELFFIKEIFNLFGMPLPEPIGDANGIIAEAPTSSNFFAIIGSSEQ